MQKILLLGCGELGSRYLQGLASVESKLFVTVVDPSIKSIDKAKSRWAEAGGTQTDHEILWLNSIPQDSEGFDLALVVTSAQERAELVKQIISNTKVRYWVLEKIVAQSKQELDAITCFVGQSEGAWVNTPHRTMELFKSLKARLNGKGPLRVKYAGGLWGLACNSIHYIDIIQWITGESIVSVLTSGLDNNWFESKRAGYFELTGSLVVQFSSGTFLELNSRQNAKVQIFQIELANGIVWNIDEITGTASSSVGEQIHGKIELQSELTGPLVNDILHNGRCDLPKMTESNLIHTPFLEAMLNHWNSSRNQQDILFPIT